MSYLVSEFSARVSGRAGAIASQPPRTVFRKGMLYDSGGKEQGTRTRSKGGGEWHHLILGYLVFLFKVSHLPLGRYSHSLKVKNFLKTQVSTKTTNEYSAANTKERGSESLLLTLVTRSHRNVMS